MHMLLTQKSWRIENSKAHSVALTFQKASLTYAMLSYRSKT